MNQLIRHLLFLLVLIASLFSCKKENPQPLPNDFLIIGEVSGSEKILSTIITSQGTVLNIYNHTLKGLYPAPPDQLKIDLDADGIMDVRFLAQTIGSPGVGPLPSVYAKSINDNFKFLVQSISDTTFLNIKNSTSLNPDASVMAYSTYTFTCERMDSKDKVDTIQNKIILALLNKGDVIDFKSLESEGNYPLYNTSIFLPIAKEYVTIGDTTFVIYEKSYTSCNLMPINQEFYLGFIMNDSKLGWIKLKLLGRSELLIMDSAIQR